MATLHAGTSGFAYATWKPDFYPPKLPAKDFLKHYATRLNAVEINYTFRQLPKTTTLENWIAATHEGFTFVVKAHQKITHIDRLRGYEFLEVFFKAIDPLRATRRLGPVLFQLPPNMKCDTVLLDEFLAKLPGDLRCAFEFRNASWLTDETYKLLQSRNAALCLAESEKFEVPPVITADFVYVRLRKPDYSPEERADIAERVKQMLGKPIDPAVGSETLLSRDREGAEASRDVYCFFKHEDTPAGAQYAEELLRAV